MTDSFRPLARRGLEPFVGSVPPGPDWAELTGPVTANPGRNRLPAWVAASAAAVVVAAVFGIPAILFNEGTPTTVPTVDPGPAEHWGAVFVEGSAAILEPENYTSLSEMFDASDAVILATITGVREGRIVDGLTDDSGYRYVVLEIEVEEEFRRAHDEMPDDYLIELMSRESLDLVSDTVVGTRGYFYLGHKTDEAEGAFFGPISSQGLIIDDRGSAFFPLGDASDRLVWEVTGRPFHLIVPGGTPVTSSTTSTTTPTACPSGEPKCDGPFESRAGHIAIWTGAEVLIYGGENSVIASTSGLAYNPETRTWRDLAPAPQPVVFWWREPVVWTGEEMVVAGRPDGYTAPVVMLYSPTDDRWRMASPAPEEKNAIGAMVWTGSEVLFVGGDNLFPSADGWAYNLATDTWRPLPDPGLTRVEGIEGVWTGTEAVFIGGYSFMEQTPTVAYNPATNSWRRLADSPIRNPDQHHLVWTGEQVIVYTGHAGPGHAENVSLYDPATDRWTDSSAMPLLPREHLASAWTGEYLILWGGSATYGVEPDSDGDHVFGDGAMYHPATDTWTMMPNSPLADRCGHSGTWTGEEFIVFGGLFQCNDPALGAAGDAATFHFESGEWSLLD